MKAKDLTQNERAKLLNRVRFKEEASMALYALMEREGLRRVELADRLGRSRSFITKILDAQHNFTLDLFADVCFELGYAPHFFITRDTTRMIEPAIQDDDALTINSYVSQSQDSVLEIGSDAGNESYGTGAA